MISRLIPLLRRVAPDPEHVSIAHGGQSFPVRVTRHARARRFSLRLSAKTHEIILTLPARGSLRSAIAFAKSQSAWIAGKVLRAPERVAFADGARIPFRGVEHLIVHRPAPRGVVTPARNGAGEPILAVYGDAAHIHRRVCDFLAREAKRDLAAAVQRHSSALGIEARRIAVKDTVSRWGSCSAAGRLSFSWRLIMAPPYVLDYLAAHETAHLKEMNHSYRFWRIVAGLDPHWREAERWLSREGGALHRYG